MRGYRIKQLANFIPSPQPSPAGRGSTETAVFFPCLSVDSVAIAVFSPRPSVDSVAITVFSPRPSVDSVAITSVIIRLQAR